ncbi:hypothetical protein ES705_26300 [subsurface metagenome]
MLLNREEYRWIKKDNFERKLKKFYLRSDAALKIWRDWGFEVRDN